VNLSGSVTIRSLSIGATAVSTLTITNGNVDTKILIVTNDVTIGPNGTLTHVADWSTGTTVGSESNRLCLVVSNNLTIAAGGQINVDLKGYNSSGPGRGSAPSDHASGHGGEGGTYGATGAGGTTYGSITNPINSGTGQNGRGGGVVVVRVTGAMTHNGAITAKGGPGEGSNAGGSSGGSINLTVSSITGTGTLSVVGGESPTGRATGGGGRIAVKVTGVGTAPDSILANITAGVAGNYTTVSRGAAGTIYIQDATRTNLIVDQQNMTNSARGACTLLHDVTNGFSNVIVTNGALLAVGTNAQLNLDGCTLLTPPSTMATTNITSRLIIKDNGMLNWTGTWTNNGCISWYSNNYARMWNGSLVVASNAILTHEAGETHAIRLNLGGDLTLATNAAIWVQGMGYQNRTGIGLGDGNGSGSHGGEGGLGASSTYRSRTYGSVTNPITPGSCGSYAVNGGNPPNGGGVVIVRAAGAASVYGTIDASSGTMLDRPGSGGGSVNILAAALAGTGQIVAKGGDTTATAGGGGGRIAVVLTNSATFGNVLMSAVGGSKGSVYGEGGAGTIYLKTINQPYGLLIVSNCYATANGTTLISTQVTDAVVGDVQILGTGTKLVVSNTCTLTVYGSWSNAVATNAISGGTVVLAGASPATVWGGNTWSNLTITTAGKVVSFEHSKTQTVYGIPAFSNVTLRSTLDNTQWHLRKSGNGYQDVGVVTVYDSNAGTDGTHLTFRGAVGSVVSDPQNVNWDAFKAKGTLIMMR
jgi:hypothetical protein